MNVTEHLETFVHDVTEQNVSDIAFSPNAHPRSRLNGSWQQHPQYTPLTQRDLVQLICQTHSNLRTEDDIWRVLRRDNRMNYATVLGTHNFRVNVGLTNGDPFLILRPIARKIPTLDELGLLPPLTQNNAPTIDLSAVLKNIVTNARGLVIVTGATGSGKSTTLAAMIHHYNQTTRGHIITIEDPIEYVHKEDRSIIHQRMVGPGNDVMTYLDGVEDAMRQAPDIILLGEVRDKETMTAALAAAETGHLVFCTLHTRDAPTTIQRVLGFYGPGEKEAIRSQFANCLVAVISQQIIPRLHPHDNGRMRQMVMEILQPDNGMRNIIREDKPIQGLRDQQKSTRDLGNVIMDDELLRAVKLGFITAEAALSRSIARDKLEERMKVERIGIGA